MRDLALQARATEENVIELHVAAEAETEQQLEAAYNSINLDEGLKVRLLQQGRRLSWVQGRVTLDAAAQRASQLLEATQRPTATQLDSKSGGPSGRSSARYQGKARACYRRGPTLRVPHPALKCLASVLALRRALSMRPCAAS